jgi:hypothetical protein
MVTIPKQRQCNEFIRLTTKDTWNAGNVFISSARIGFPKNDSVLLNKLATGSVPLVMQDVSYQKAPEYGLNDWVTGGSISRTGRDVCHLSSVLAGNEAHTDPHLAL